MPTWRGYSPSFRIIDIHAHYGQWPFPISIQSLEDIEELMCKNNITYCFLSSSLAITYDFVMGNAELMDAIKGRKGFKAYIVVNPNYPSLSQKEIDKYLCKREVVGLKIHPVYTGRPLDDPVVIELIKYSWRKCPKPILLHTWGREGVEAAAKLSSSLPRVVLILGHMGGPLHWPAAAELAREREGVYLEICSSTLPPGRIKEAVRIAGVEKVLFGSDLPLLNPAFVLGDRLSSSLSREELERVLYLNASSLFAM